MIINTLDELKQTLRDKNFIINNLNQTSEQTKLDELKIQQQNLKQQSIKIHNKIKNLKKLELNNCHSNKSDNYLFIVFRKSLAFFHVLFTSSHHLAT